MTNQHPITPPPELVKTWVNALEFSSDQEVFSMIARWGADQELEACCEEIKSLPSPLGIPFGAMASNALRTTRRPKPPTLKDQALAELEILRIDANTHGLGFDAPAIRRALEALPND
jgi:hypothetical protein